MLPLPTVDVVRPDLLERRVIDKVSAVMAIDEACRALDGEGVVLAVLLARVADVGALEAEISCFARGLDGVGRGLVGAGREVRGGVGRSVDGADDAGVAFGCAVAGGLEEGFDMCCLVSVPSMAYALGQYILHPKEVWTGVLGLFASLDSFLTSLGVSVAGVGVSVVVAIV